MASYEPISTSGSSKRRPRYYRIALVLFSVAAIFALALAIWQIEVHRDARNCPNVLGVNGGYSVDISSAGAGTTPSVKHAINGLAQDYIISLRVRCNETTKGIALEPIQRISSLKGLVLINASDVALEGFRAPQIQTLILHRCAVTAKALRELQERLPNCKITVTPDERV